MDKEIVLAIIGGTFVVLSSIFQMFKIDVTEILRKKLNPKNDFNDSLLKDTKINEMLAQIRDYYGFSRVCLIDYHNGISSLNGFSFKSASMRNERTDLTTRKVASVSFFSADVIITSGFK